MKYTKNLHNKLLLAGFEFEYEHEENIEEHLVYTVYKKGLLDITVCDSHKNTDVYIGEQELNHLSYDQVMKLDKLINKK